MLAKSSNDCCVFKIKVENLESMKVSKNSHEISSLRKLLHSKGKTKAIACLTASITTPT